MLKVLSRISVILLLFLSWFPDAFGQPTLPADLKKPKKFENKKLGSEKSAEKKFTAPRRFIQNTVTQYNWFFNANNKLSAIVERAKLGHKDDFSLLLPFYNYSIEQTALDKNELDSVIYKANTGILIHDLRNDWIDNLFMLMGQAYYYKKDLDSAYLTFQYINYAFSPKEKDGYDIPIGSNSNEGGNAFSVSTKESQNIIKRTLGVPPSRNKSFIWQIKTYLQRDMLPEASSLIQTLKNDPLFPERLALDLNEVQALFFYKQNLYDSSAFYLEKALGNAANREETSRWEYLIAQLYERAHHNDLAKEFYSRAIKHTLDPVLDVYARVSSIRQNTGDSLAIKKNLEALAKMGKKGRYLKYRDIIYYAAAQIELERNNIAGAKIMLLKSTAAATENLNNTQRTKSFLLLGDLSFDEKIYPDAKRFYDSINSSDPGIPDPVALEKRKDALGQIVSQLNIIHRQDSLQALALMPEAERLALLKKIVRQNRKTRGFKEEETGNEAVRLNNANAPPPDLFADGSSNDWYFNNPSLKSKGFNSFKTIWGKRANVDNWRRNSAASQANSGSAQKGDNAVSGNEADSGNAEGMTIASLLENIPLTQEQLEVSKDSVGNALLDLGILYVNSLEEYTIAIETLEKFTEEHTYNSRMPEALYYLYYCYQKTGKKAEAAAALKNLQDRYAGTKYEQQLNDALTGKSANLKTEVTRAYEKIYTLFIEGDFEKALALKKITDSAYGTSYWTPHLLYIESVYYLKQRMDPEAKKTLEKIIELYAGSPLAERSKAILEVLGRRKEIEDYLTNLKIERVNEDSVALNNKPATARLQQKEPQKQPAVDSIQTNPDTAKVLEPAADIPAVKTPPAAQKDTAAIKDSLNNKPAQPNIDNPADKQPADVKNDTTAIKDSLNNKPAQPNIDKLTDKQPADIKKDTAAVKDSLNNKPVQPNIDKLADKQPADNKKDMAAVVAKLPQLASIYSFNPETPHYVTIILNKVDPVYVTESRNAFDRYNKANYNNKTIDIVNQPLNDSIKLVVMSGFESAAAALEYMEKTRAIAATQIVPWLPAGKYSFFIISAQNAEILKSSQDVEAYRKFLRYYYPGKF